MDFYYINVYHWDIQPSAIPAYPFQGLRELKEGKIAYSPFKTALMQRSERTFKNHSLPYSDIETAKWGLVLSQKASGALKCQQALLQKIAITNFDTTTLFFLPQLPMQSESSSFDSI